MLSDYVTRVASRLAGLPTHTKVLLTLASIVMVVELAFRRFWPKSRAYALWTRFFLAIGKVWTAVLLAIVYFISVSVIAAILRILRQDPLDRALQPEPSFWRRHEPNPLGPQVAARHQF